MTTEKGPRIEVIAYHLLETPCLQQSKRPLNVEHLDSLLQKLRSLESGEPSQAKPLLDLGFEEATSENPKPKSKKQHIYRNVQERLRGLTPSQQRKVAATGEQSERVALERMYGKTVWEALLGNPKLTNPEVARLARMGNLPRPLLERICNNRTWVRFPQVRRALLANHRLSKEQSMVVLRATPKPELKLVPKQVSYPMRVRDLASKMLS